jgi:TonB family protein
MTLRFAFICCIVAAVPSYGQRPPGRCRDTSSWSFKLLPPPQAMRPNADLDDTTAYPECAVDRVAAIHARRYPDYPPMLAGARVDGVVRVEFTILPTGAIDTARVKVLRSSHDLFTRAVREAMATWTAEPARLGQRRVPEQLEYEFRFLADCRGPPRLVLGARAASEPHAVEICPLR